MPLQPTPADCLRLVLFAKLREMIAPVNSRQRPRITGLDAFGLTRAALLRLGPRPVHLSIQLTGETVSKLWHLGPKQRDATLRETLAKQLNHLRAGSPRIEVMLRMPLSWYVARRTPAGLLNTAT